MPQALIILELARAWQSYFRTKGGAGPNVAGDILATINFDDSAAYPPFRAWYSGHTLGGTAAVFSYLGWQNTDPSGVKSVCVIDAIVAGVTGTADLSMGILTSGTLGALSATAPVQDRAEEKDQAPTDLPSLGNVIRGSFQSATGYGNILHPGGVATPSPGVEIKGPWTLGPQAIFVIRPTVLNIGLTCYARGRYYPAL